MDDEQVFFDAVGVLVALGYREGLQRVLDYAQMVLEGDQDGAEQLYADEMARWMLVQVFGPEGRQNDG